ncbi:plastid-lipid-associated protein 6 [Asimina triloba]
MAELQLGTPWPIPNRLICSFNMLKMKPPTAATNRGCRLPDALRPPSNTGTGEFEDAYVDADTHITRDERGELRVFV